MTMQEPGQLNKALIITSDPIERRFLEDLLNEHGYQVRWAEGIRAAFQLFKTEVFSLIISDLEFPRSDRREVFDLIRRYGFQTKVVLIAPDVDAEVYIKARAWGAFDCIGKSQKSSLRGVIMAARN